MSEIKIEKITPRIRYIADGNTTEFPFLFAIFNEDDLDVYLDTALQSSNLYQVAIDNENHNGKITFSEAPAKDKVITILRRLDIKRTSDFQEGGAFRAKTINHELDYQTACIQQLEEEITRALTLPPYSSMSVNLTMPLPEKGKAIVWNQDGTSLTNSNIEVDTALIDIENAVTAAQQNAAQAQQHADETAQKALQVSTDAATVSEQTQIVVNSLSTKVNTSGDNFAPSGKANIIDFCSADWSRKVELTDITGTIPQPGFLYMKLDGHNGKCINVQINDVIICAIGAISQTVGGSVYNCASTCQVNTGDVWKVVDNNVAGGNRYIYFCPMKGVPAE